MNISDENAPILIEKYVNKLTRHNDKQTRKLVMAGGKIYLFKGETMNRRHDITHLSAFIFSKTSSEVIFCFPEAKDLRIEGLSPSENMHLLKLVKDHFHEWNSNALFEVFEVDEESLNEYTSEGDKEERQTPD